QYSMMCASVIAQEGAIEALKNGADQVERMREHYHRRRDIIVRRLNEVGLKCHSPRGSFYAFPDVSASGLDGAGFAKALLEREKVAVVPGAAFGENGRAHVRACFATGQEQLVEACDRVARFMETTKR
ncbi:MAG TPA: aminotransferase class I/II-fold pyridoxal phosphate-dependent enzyme, partial [Opitutaceae bacterium]